MSETLSDLRGEVEGARQEMAQVLDKLQSAESHLAFRDEENVQNLTRIDQYQTRIKELEQDLAAMRSSRSWRWSGWLRALWRRRRI